jgi:hypothetical protein
MSTQHDIEKEEALSRASPPVQQEQVLPGQTLPQPPQRPPTPKRNRWVVIVASVLMLALVAGLGILLIPGVMPQTPPPGSKTTPTTAPTTAPTAAPTTAPTTPTPGPEISPTPAPPGVVLGPRACPAGIGDPAHWDAIIGTNNGTQHAESVSCANILDNPSLQALVLVRHTDANYTLDVYVFNNITSSNPTRIFLLQGLIKGDAKISGYNTVMTAEVDAHSSLNADKLPSAMIPDLFREFDWSAEQNTLVQTAFPGLFPDLTRYQAEADQVQVNQGHQPWKMDPQLVAKAMATSFFDWKQSISTKLLSGGGLQDVSAVVQVQEAAAQGAQSQGPNVIMTLSRLEGNTHNLWVVISVDDGSMLTLTNLDARSLVASPVTLEGTGSAFEAVIGRAVVYDHLYTTVGQAQITGDRGMGKANYITNVAYDTSFKAGPQEGIVAVYEANGGISDEIYTAVMRKVLLSPEPGVALGPVPCPSAVSDPAYWTPFVTNPPATAVAEQVSCGNLLGQPGLQAMVVAREILGGGPTYRSVFVFDNITSAQPKLLFKLENMLNGDAQISNYSTIMTAEGDADFPLTTRGTNGTIYREFQWSAGAGKFVQVAFPGIFPDLTRYQAVQDQRLVNEGQGTWKNDPQAVAKAMAKQFFGWNRPLASKILSGGGAQDVDASVQVQEAPPQGLKQGPTVTVTLSRLGGKTYNMWVAIAAQDGSGALTSVQARQLVSSPVLLAGKGNAFENTIGMAYILDHQYTKVGQAIVTGNSGNGMGNTTYSIQVSYQTLFKQGPQEGVVELQLTSPIESDPYSGVLVKVLLSPQPRVVQGPVSCPIALQAPDYWQSTFGLAAGTVSCANLKGDASLQALVPVVPSEGEAGHIYVFDNLTGARPVQIFSMETGNSMISNTSTILTADTVTNARNIYREFQWSKQAGTFVQVAFPGMYPDMTHWQAVQDQFAVNLGKDSWKRDALQTATHFASAFFVGSTATLTSGGGPRDLVAHVNLALTGGGTPRITNVTLNRLEGNVGGIWEVTEVTSNWLYLSSPSIGATISSPVTVQGFGPQFEAVIGTVYILDAQYQQIQVGNNFAMAPDGSSPPSPFSLDVKYTSSFQSGVQEGIVELVHTGGASFDSGVALTKVLIGK